MSEIGNMVDIEAVHGANVFGSMDQFAKKIEKTLHVSIIYRDSKVRIVGGPTDVKRCQAVLANLLELSRRGNVITEQNVDYALALTYEDKTSAIVEIDNEIITRTIAGKPIKPKTLGQKEYIDSIKKNTIVFGIGPAGTGKTYLAMAMAIEAFKNNEVNRVNLVPFRNIRTYLDVWGSYGFENLAGHVVAFIPVGIGIRYLFAKNSIKAVLWCLLITVLFEVIQYVFCIGFLDVDDIILNLVGSVIGILVCKWFMRKRKSFSQ